jgi:hypothetical protein
MIAANTKISNLFEILILDPILISPLIYIIFNLTYKILKGLLLKLIFTVYKS